MTTGAVTTGAAAVGKLLVGVVTTGVVTVGKVKLSSEVSSKTVFLPVEIADKLPVGVLATLEGITVGIVGNEPVVVGAGVATVGRLLVGVVTTSSYSS